MAPNAAVRDEVLDDIDGIRTRAIDNELGNAQQLMVIARDDLDGPAISALTTKGMRAIPFNRRKTITIADAGAPSTLVDLTNSDNQPKPFPFGQTEQPSAETLIIQALSIEVKSDELLDSLEVLRKLGVRVIRQDGEVGMEFPLADMLDTGIYAADAGALTGPVTVVGTHHQIKAPKAIPFTGRQVLVVAHGDSTTGIEFFKLPEFVAADFVLTETADIDLVIGWKGLRIARSKGKA